MRNSFNHMKNENVILLSAEAYDNALANLVLTASSNCVSDGVLFNLLS